MVKVKGLDDRHAMAPSERDIAQMTARSARNRGYSDGYAGKQSRSTLPEYREAYRRGQQARNG